MNLLNVFFKLLLLNWALVLFLSVFLISLVLWNKDRTHCYAVKHDLMKVLGLNGSADLSARSRDANKLIYRYIRLDFCDFILENIKYK